MKLALNWNGPSKMLAVGPASADPSVDGRLSAAELFYLDLFNDNPGLDASCRVSVTRYKPCANLHDTSDPPRYLVPVLTSCVLNNFTAESPSYNVTQQP